jgi:hypothetical protein
MDHGGTRRALRRDRASHRCRARIRLRSKIGKLDKALDEAKAKGWTLVDMKQDWKKVFAVEP